MLTEADHRTLLTELLAMRTRNRDAVEQAHRDMRDLEPTLHKRLLCWLVDHEPASVHLPIGLALLATDSDQSDRQLAARLLRSVPVEVVCDTVAYVRGWTVERTLSWIQHYRRLCIRWEKSTTLFQGFLHLGCTMLLLKEVLG